MYEWDTLWESEDCKGQRQTDRDRLYKEYIQKFHIQDEISFCLYLQTTSLNQPFEGISYNDIQAFKRFQEDPEYYERVQTILKEKEQSSKGKIIKFSKYIDIKKDKE